MSEVTRYTDGNIANHLRVSTSGEYVLHSDFEKLEAQLAVAVEAIEKCLEMPVSFVAGKGISLKSTEAKMALTLSEALAKIKDSK